MELMALEITNTLLVCISNCKNVSVTTVLFYLIICEGSCWVCKQQHSWEYHKHSNGQNGCKLYATEPSKIHCMKVHVDHYNCVYHIFRRSEAAATIFFTSH